MPDSVTSRFSISSPRLGADHLKQRFPWQIEEAVKPGEGPDYYVTSFNLGLGAHDRVDSHLVAIKDVLLAKESELNALSHDCSYVVWIRYQFAAPEGAFGLSPSIQAAFSLLRLEVIFQIEQMHKT